MLPQIDITSFGLPRLTYKANDLQACCNIPIADDNILETTETFAIRVFPCSSELNYVIIDENLADIIIMDNDCKLEIKMA